MAKRPRIVTRGYLIKVLIPPSNLHTLTFVVLFSRVFLIRNWCRQTRDKLYWVAIDAGNHHFVTRCDTFSQKTLHEILSIDVAFVLLQQKQGTDRDAASQHSIQGRYARGD
jgi:hypothetical protein